MPKRNKNANCIPKYESKKPQENLAYEGNSEVLIHKRVEEYQLITSINKATTPNINSVNNNNDINYSAIKASQSSLKKSLNQHTIANNDNKTLNNDNHHSIKFKKPIESNDKESYNNKHMTEEDKCSSYRETPFKKMEKLISESNIKRQSHRPKSIFNIDILQPEWLLTNKKNKSTIKNNKNKAEPILIQKYWRGYSLRKRLFNELRIFYQSNQFVYYIEDVEKKKTARFCFNKLRHSATNDNDTMSYNTINTNSKPYFKGKYNNSNLYNKITFSNKETQQLKGKRSNMLLLRALNNKHGTVFNEKKYYFEQWYNNTYTNLTKLRKKIIVKHYPTSLNSNKSLKIARKVCFVDYLNKDSTNHNEKNALMKSAMNDKLVPIVLSYDDNDNEKDNMSFYKNEYMLLIVRKHLKLNAVMASYKNNLLLLYLMKWKQNGENFNYEDLKNFKGLFYVKIISRNLLRFYSRKASHALNKWLRNTILIRKQLMKKDYTSCLMIRNAVITAYRKKYIEDVAKALKSKMPKSDDKCLIF